MILSSYLATSFTQEIQTTQSLTLLFIITTYLFWINMRCSEYFDKPKNQQIATTANSASHLNISSIILAFELLLLILIFLITNFFTSDKLELIFPQTSFIYLAISIISSYLILLFIAKKWQASTSLFWVDMTLIIHPILFTFILSSHL